MSATSAIPRLTSLSHGGGCGCKIAPGVLSELLAQAVPTLAPADLLVGREGSDDAAVYRLNDEQAIVATTDFFMPIVDDPYDFGRIAATNALSDVYAMGGRPILALALVGMPIKQLPADVIRQILAGGEAVCADAGIVIAGGHSIDSVEPIYGLAALGLVHPARVKRNGGACAGDALVLGKPLGVGIYSAAFKQGRLDAAGYSELIATTTRLNTIGATLGLREDVHALTDVTGFGLLGHLLEVCRASRLAATLSYAALPWLVQAPRWAAEGIVTGASARNWASYGAEVALDPALDATARALLCDPQTSGGLLVACAPDSVDAVVDAFRREGFEAACAIGHLEAGLPHVDVRA